MKPWKVPQMITEVQNHSPYASHVRSNGSTSRAESTRRPAQIHADYRRHNPRRQLDWRWQRASQLINYGEEPDPVYEDGWTRRACEYRRMTVDHSTETLANAMPDIYAACQLKAIGGAPCWELEARILARETPEVIESKTGVIATVIECYQKMFFNVVGRIDCKTYITAMAIGQRPFDGHNVAAIWNHFAYYYGSHILDAVIDDFRKTSKPDYMHLITERDWWKGRSRFQRTLDRSIALLMFKVDNQNYMALLRMQVAVMSLQFVGKTMFPANGIEDLVDEAMSDLFSARSEMDSTADMTEEYVA